MRSTGVISASDYPISGSDRQHFNEKQHPDSGKRLFQARIGCKVCSIGPEISTNCNDTAGCYRNERQEVVSWGSRSGFPVCRHRPGPDLRIIWPALVNTELFREKKNSRR
jgi:hypothetical protein